MICIHNARDDIELLGITTWLEAEGIPHFVRNQNFSSLYPGTAIPYFNEKSVCVPEDFAAAARAVVREFLQQTGQNEQTGEPGDVDIETSM